MKLTLVILAVLLGLALASPSGRRTNELEQEVEEIIRNLGKGQKGGRNGGPKGDGPKGDGPKGGRGDDSKSESKDKDEGEGAENERKDKKEKMFEAIADKCGIQVPKDKAPKPVKEEDAQALMKDVQSFLNEVTSNMDENEKIFAKAKDVEDAVAVSNTHKEAIENMAKLGADKMIHKVFCLRVKAGIMKYRLHAFGLDQEEFKDVPQCLSTCTTLVTAAMTKTSPDWAKVPAAIQGDHACLKGGIGGVKGMVAKAQANIRSDPFILPKVEYMLEILFTRGHQLHACSMGLHQWHAAVAGGSKPEAEPEKKTEERELINALEAYLKNH